MPLLHAQNSALNERERFSVYADAYRLQDEQEERSFCNTDKTKQDFDEKVKNEHNIHRKCQTSTVGGEVQSGY
jgi:hypothetical protein